MLMLTATATKQVRVDVLASLGVRHAAMVQGSFDRPNVIFKVRRVDGLDDAQVITLLLTTIRTSFPPKSCGIVYCNTRLECEQVANALSSRGLQAAPYHAGPLVLLLCTSD